MGISINTQILAGNLGDGWKNNADAAYALAKFTEEVWRKDLEKIYNNDEIEIVIDIEPNMEGYSRDMSFYASHRTDKEIEAILTTEDKIWEMFCGSEETEILAE